MAAAYRAQASRWYSSARWQHIRAQQLASEPICRMCRAQGDVKPATVADHITPHKGDYEKFWNGKLQSLCKSHHDSDKALIEAGKAPRQTTEAWLASAWPMDRTCDD